MSDPTEVVSESDVRELLDSLHGQLCWGVKNGLGASITLEFGEPELEVHEPIRPAAGATDNVTSRPARRRVRVVGEWSLWILSPWRLVTNDGPSSSSAALEDGEEKRVVAELNGRIVESVQTFASGESRFTFEDGVVVETDEGDPDDRFRWLLQRADHFSLAFLGAKGFRLQRP